MAELAKGLWRTARGGWQYIPTAGGPGNQNADLFGALGRHKYAGHAVWQRAPNLLEPRTQVERGKLFWRAFQGDALAGGLW